MNRKKITEFVLIFSMLLLSAGCNNKEYVSGTDVLVTLPNGNNTIYKFAKRYFLLQPGDTAQLYGTRVCTVVTNGIISSIEDDSLYFRRITLDDTTIFVNNTPHIVYPQLYHKSSSFDSLSQFTITRYFELTDSGIFQIAYEHYNTMQFLDKEIQKVIPSPLEIGSYDFVSSGNTWRASPLIESPCASSNGTVWFIGQRVATCYLVSEKIDNYDYYDGVTIKTYYSFNGEIYENNEPARLSGTIVITRNYFKDIGLVNELRILEAQKSFSDNGVQLTKERVYFSRGPEGAKVYNDWEGTGYSR